MYYNAPFGIVLAQSVCFRHLNSRGLRDSAIPVAMTKLAVKPWSSWVCRKPARRADLGAHFVFDSELSISRTMPRA